MSEFSVAVICKDEENTLPILLASLKGVKDIVVVDTGSTDNTVDIAKKNRAIVQEVGDRFIEIPTKKDIELFEKRYGFKPSFNTETRLFNYSKARNYALTLTKNDWVFQPDADEIVEWDLEEVEKLLDNTDQLNYLFCFQHNPDGSCALEFMHTKFFKKSKLKWIKKVHEIHTPIEGQNPQNLYTDKIYLHHWQKQSDNRANYLPKLEYAILENENDDRNTYYLGREYFYNSQWEKAIKVLKKALNLGWWKPELGQAYIEMGICYENLGNKEEAEKCFYESIRMNDRRREPFKYLAEFLEKNEQLERAITYYEGAATIPFQEQGYLNQKNLYGWIIPDKLAMLYDRIGKKDQAKKWWIEAMKYNPPEVIVKNGLNYFYDKLPLISIVVPTCRPEGFNRLEKSIRENTVYPNYEIIKKDGEGTAIKKFNQGVEEAKGELIVFIADDCEAKKGWLENAFICFKEKFRDRGLVIFNDNHWNGTLANHFLCSKNLREDLDGTIWSEAYFHNSVDVELMCRLKAKNLVEYCEYAQIIHHHYFCNSKDSEKNYKDEFYKKIEANCQKDRMLLPKRLEALGLHEDAIKYQEWFDKLLQGDPDGPERTAVGSLRPVPEFEATRYQWARDKATGKTVLDIGCSSGFGSRFFEGFDYTGIDYNKDIIEFAKDQYGNENVKFINADINTVDLDFYDNIIVFECLEHLPNGKELAQELKKHCNNLFCTVPYKEPVGAWGKYHLIHNLTENNFPGFEYKWMHRNGKVYDTPDPTTFNLMYMHWHK